MSTNTTQLLGQYLTAARGLLQAGLEQLKVEDPQQYSDVAVVANAGGMFKIETGMSTAGLFEVNISIVDATGQSVNLMHTETGVVNH